MRKTRRRPTRPLAVPGRFLVGYRQPGLLDHLFAWIAVLPLLAGISLILAACW